MRFDALQISADIGVVGEIEAVGCGLQRIAHHDVGTAEAVADQPFAVFNSLLMWAKMQRGLRMDKLLLTLPLILRAIGLTKNGMGALSIRRNTIPSSNNGISEPSA